MTVDQLLRRMNAALLACVEELDAFDPDDRQTIDFANEVFDEYTEYHEGKNNA